MIAQEFQEYAVIIGTYVNACSIIEGLHSIGYPYGIIAIDPCVDNAKCLAEVIYPETKVIKKKIANLDDIVALINNHIDESKKKTIFMTSEEFIEPVRKAIEDGRLRNTKAHTGSGIDNELIFDRYKFYQFVENIGIHNVPRTISSDTDPVKAFGKEYIIRVNKSWEDNKKLPRLRIVHSKEEKEEVENEFLNSGLTPDMWSYQELLSTVDTHNVSVCGWYDEQYHQYAITRKILQHPPKVGNGDVVEIYLDAPETLIIQTEKILKALKYEGAFEMEYVLDAQSGEYKLIELNPRFWMQHGLVEKTTDYALIRRAIRQNDLITIPVRQLQYKVWINGTQALYRLGKGQFILFKYLIHGLIVPSITQAIKWALFYKQYVKECNQKV